MELLFNFLKPEIILTLVLLFMLGMRMRVRPRASLYIDASPAKLFETIDAYDGRVFDFGRTKIALRQLSDPTEYEFTYSTSMADGRLRSTTAVFNLVEKIAGEFIHFKRKLENPKLQNNELLEFSQRVVADGKGARLQSEYVWGPRPLIAQILARTDLIGGAYRLKGIAETGVANNRPYLLLSASVCLLTGVLAVLAFAYFTGWLIAVLAIFSLLIHELGHLIAYRLIGQPWGRIVFLPFLGAVAIPRLPFENQGQVAFAALMGPGISVLLSLACWLPMALGHIPYESIVLLGVVTAGINLLNLLPVEPLDGGVALRSIVGGLNPRFAKSLLLGLSLAAFALGSYFSNILVMIIGGIAVLANIKQRKIDGSLKPMPFHLSFISTAVYFGVVSLHLMVLLTALKL